MMIAEIFLACAFALPLVHFTKPPLVPWQAAADEEEQLKEWLKKHDEVEDVFITPRGQADKLKDHGWERLPWTINDKQIWIQRKPKSDSRNKKLEVCA